MTAVTIHASGGDAIATSLERQHAKLEARYPEASRAAAVVMQKAIAAEVPGRLKKQVRVEEAGGSTFVARVGGRLAHLVLGDTRSHEVDPSTMRALSYQGADHPFARAVIPAHRGDHNAIERARAAGAEPAKAAAAEVLKSVR